jgi:hypothetical protein
MTKIYCLDASRKLLALMLAIALWCCVGCGGHRDEDCVRKIASRIPIGLAANLAEAELKKCGFKITFDAVKRTYYADKVIPDGVTDKRTQVLIQLDDNGRVSAVQVTPSITAP